MKNPDDDDNDEGTPHFSPTEAESAPFSPMNEAAVAEAFGVAGIKVGEPTAIIPRLPPISDFLEEHNVKKKAKIDGWNDDMLLLSEEGLLILD